MNREIEERIVAMHFDNEDFEKNAKSTIDTLDQLKKGLNLEDAARGFSVFEKLGKTLNFEKANQSLTKIRNGLSSMNGALGKVFKIGEAPLKEAEGMVNTIRGYLNKVIGFDFASKIVGGIENIFRSLTIAPVSAGWDQYQSKMDSVKTIMSSTGESIEVVEKHLAGLTTYANKTIYSLTDMTSNLGKFTNNGVKLEDAVMAMEGIANAAADAGQGAQQASMAMYNFSQAMGVGKMTSIDWKSIENANMATGRLKDTFLQVAAAGGRITKEIKKVGEETQETFWLTTDENGKALKSKIQLTKDNFREYLSKGWLDKETMMRALQIYSGAGIDQDILNAWGITDPEQQKALLKIGEDALEAATQVRTFSKMLDALKESVQSGWATSFETIFGNMEEGTQLWTKLNDRLDKILSESSDRRNSILKAWAETTEGDQAYWTRDELGNKVRTGVEGGRDILINSFFELMDVVQMFSKAVSRAFNSVFGGLNSKKLFSLTVRFRDFAKGLKTWLGSFGNANSRISKLSQGLKGIFGIIKAGLRIAKSLFDLAKRLAMPVIDFLIDKFGEFGKFFQVLGKMNIPEMFKYIWGGIKNAWQHIKDMFTKSEGMTEIPFITKVKEIWNKFKNIIHGWFDDIGLGQVWNSVAEWWDNLKTSFQEGWDAVKKWWDDTGIGEWFRGIWNKIVGLFTAPSIENFLPEGYNGNVDLSVRPQVKMEVVTKRGWVDENGNPLGGDYATVLTNTFSVGKKSEGYDFEYKENATINITPILPNGDVLSPEELEDYIAELTRESLKTGKTIQELDKEKKGLLLSYDIVPEGMTLEEAYNEAGKWAENLHNLQEQWDEVKDKDPPIVQFFNDLGSKIEGAWNTLISLSIWTDIATFFEGVWNSVVSWFTPKTITGKQGFTWTENAPIVQFFIDIGDKIKEAWDKLVSLPIWTDIATFFEGVWNSVVDYFTPKVITGKQGFTWTENAPIVQFFIDLGGKIESAWLTLTSLPIWTDIATFFTGVWNSIVDWFTPGTTIDAQGNTIATGSAPIVKFFEGLWSDMEGIYTKISDWWNSDEVQGFFKTIGEFFSHLWEKILGLFGGGEESENGTNEIRNSGSNGPIRTLAKAVDLVSDVGSGAKEIDKKVPKDPTLVERALDFIQRLMSTVADFFSKIFEAIKGVVITPAMQKFIDAAGEFLTGLMKVITDVMGSFGKLMNGKVGTDEWKSADFANVLLTIIGVIAGIIIHITTMKWSSKLLSSTQSIGSQFMQFAGGLLMIAGALALLTIVDQKKLDKAAQVMLVLGVVFGAIVGIISQIEATKSIHSVTSSERVLTNLINKAALVGILFIALEKLPVLIDKFKEVEQELGGKVNIGDDIMKTLIGVVALLGGMAIALATASMIAPKGIDPIAAVKTVVALLAAVGVVIAALAGGSWIMEKLFDKGWAQSLEAKIATAGLILGAIGTAIGRFFYGLFFGGAQVEQTANAEYVSERLNAMANAFDSESVSGILRIADMLSDLSSSVNGISGYQYGKVTAVMEDLVGGIHAIYNLVNGTDDLPGLGDPGSVVYKRYSGAIDIIRKLTEALSPMKGVDSSNLRAMREFITNFGNDDELLAGFVTGLRKLLTALGTDGGTDGIQFDGLAIVGKLYAAIQEGMDSPDLPSFDATSIVDAICEAIGLGENGVAVVVREMVQKGLELKRQGEKNPELKLDASQLEFLTSLSESGGSLEGMFDYTELEKQIQQITGQMEGLDKSVPTVESLFKDKGYFDFKGENGEPIDLVGELQTHIGELSSTLETMEPLKIKITPVIDFTQLTPGKVQEELDKYNTPLTVGTDTLQMRIDYTGLDSALDMASIRMALDGIKSAVITYGANAASAVSGLASHMDGIASEVASLKLWLDTGVLVGAITPMIDRELYRRQMAGKSTGV